MQDGRKEDIIKLIENLFDKKFSDKFFYNHSSVYELCIEFYIFLSRYLKQNKKDINEFLGEKYEFVDSIMELGSMEEVASWLKRACNTAVDYVLKDRKLTGEEMIDPNSETSLNPIIEEAYNKGIPVIAFDQPVSSPYAINVVIDQQKWGEKLAKWLSEELDGKGNIVIVEGLKGHPANENRMIGMRRILEKYPGINVLASINADWDQANAQHVMSDLLYTYPNIDGVLTQDGMSLGVLKAYITANRKLPKVTGETMVGFLRMWKELKTKSEFSSFGQNNPPGVSNTALGIAVRILHGQKLKPLPDNTFYYSVKDLVTDENLEEYFKNNKDKPETYFLDEWLSEKELDNLFEAK